MWFKNIHLFRFIKPFTLSAEQFNQQLATQPFVKCGKLELVSTGWVAPFKNAEVEEPVLVHAANNCLLFALRKQEKILPAAVINEHLQEKITELEELQQRRIRKKERDALKDEVIQDLLPRAFARSHVMYAYIDVARGWLVIDTASRKKAEDFANTLRKTLGSLPVVFPKLVNAPAMVMTEWLTQQSYPDDFSLADACELADADNEGAVLNCKRQNLLSEELQGHFTAGKMVTQIALQWQAQLGFVMTEEFILKRLQFLEAFQEQAKQEAGEDAAQRFDSDFVLMSALFATLLERVFTAFGGENEAAYQQFMV
jgi:recombination associated protein RdgC